MAQQIKKKFLAPEVVDYFDNQIETVDQKIDQEILDRQNAIQGLQDQITNLGDGYATDTELASAVSALEQADAAESLARQEADSALDAKINGLTPGGLLPNAVLFGSPDGASIDRSEFLTYDASIGLLINQGGQMQTRSLEQGANDPSTVIINDKVEVVVNDVDGPAYTRMRKDYIEAKKVLSDKELSASMGFDGTDSWVGVSKTENAGNNISMIKLFPNKAQLFTVDIAAGTGPQPVLPVENYDLVVKKYADDIASNLQSAIDTEKGRVDAILSLSDADKDSFKEIVDLINSIDTENDEAFAAYALSNNAALAQEVSDRQAGDAQTLVDAKAYTDTQIAAIPEVDLSNYYTKSEVDSKESALQSSISDLDVYAQDIRSDVDALDVYAQDIRTDHDALDLRVQSLEAKGFAKGSVTIGANLEYVDLDRQFVTILSVSVGRLAVHEGEDYTVSVVGGVTRLTWIGSLAHPDGVEKVETGDKIFYSGAY